MRLIKLEQAKEFSVNNSVGTLTVIYNSIIQKEGEVNLYMNSPTGFHFRATLCTQNARSFCDDLISGIEHKEWI
jgi:hypothetical protein